jgi:hypothetical protein
MHNKEVLSIIEQDRGHSFPGLIVSLGNSRLMAPSLNYYRIARNYTWLEPIIRKPITGYEDYIYALEEDAQNLSKDDYTQLLFFPDIKAVLLRANRTQSHSPP